MNDSLDGLEKKLIQFEEKLLNNKNRGDKKFVSELLNDECIEINEAGIKIHSKISKLDLLDGVSFIGEKRDSIILSDSVILLMYEAVQVIKNKRNKVNYSSVWQNIGGKWKIIFQQKTQSK